jgi:putative FmdB family regulatory protein
MPIYEYYCQECNHIQEVFHPMTGPNEKIICQHCKRDNMAKAISAPYVKFRGDWQTNNIRGIDKTK